jgi:hypothetical protein
MQGFGSGFIATGHSVEEEGRGSRHMAGFKTTGGAGVLDGAAWQLLGIDGPTWLSGGRPAGAAQAVGGVVGRRVEQDKGGADLQGLGRWPAIEITRSAESRGDRGLRKTKEDLGAISQKCRDLTEMLR